MLDIHCPEIKLQTLSKDFENLTNFISTKLKEHAYGNTLEPFPQPPSKLKKRKSSMSRKSPISSANFNRNKARFQTIKM